MTTITVGVDGSEGSQTALRWACNEATSFEDATVVAVSAWMAPLPVASPWVGTFDLPIDLTESTAATLAKSVAAAIEPEFAALRVEQRVIHGAPGPVLLAETDHSDMVVVGTRGRGGFKGLLLGSVSHQIVNHARCPVVIVPAGTRVTAPGRPRSIVVGVDGSPNSLAAAHWAASRARATGATLRAVLVHQLPPASLTPQAIATGLSTSVIMRHAAEMELDAYLGQAALPHDVRVERITIEGSPAKALIDEAEHAHLLVVGARGHGGFTGLLLGSVATAVTRHAPCPVAVVPEP